MAQQTHFHSYKHCLLQLTHGFISSNNNQSFLSYNEELKQGNLLCRKYYYFFLYPLFRQHKHTNYMIIILSRMYQDLKFKTFFLLRKKKIPILHFSNTISWNCRKKNCWIVNLNFKQYKKINNHKLVYI